MPNYHTSQPSTETAIDRSVPDFPIAQGLDEERYFQTHAAPEYLAALEAQVRQFVAHHLHTGKRIALVTLGGTTVPLENNTVRFIDNFLAGTRGATLAECFLELDYAVIFVHREFLLLPYLRHYLHTTNNCFLDYMEERDGRVEIKPQFAPDMLAVLRKYRRAQALQLLLLVPYTTVNQYLYTLRLASQCLQPLQGKALFYLAAAVSDFFLPQLRMPQHKIQSQLNGGKLVVDLEQVPKFLRRLVDLWAPAAMIVLFKLETDGLILLDKARAALERYQHQLVIGNLLQTRKWEVVFVRPGGAPHWVRLTDDERRRGVEIESVFVPEVARQHSEWIAAHPL